MPLAKSHYVGIPVLAILQGMAWITGNQAELTTQITTIMVGVFTGISWLLSQIRAIQKLRASPSND